MIQRKRRGVSAAPFWGFGLCGVEVAIDIVIYDESGSSVCVLDTKSKLPDAPSTDDVAQAEYYALLKGCRNAGQPYWRSPSC